MGVLTGTEDDMNVQGQDVAEATGVAYSDISKPEDVPKYDSGTVSAEIATQAPISSGLNYVDEDKSTVRGQLSRLLDSDSSYIKQAEQAGTKQAAERGLLNTSMAAGASRRAAIESALPIAQQDAKTFATAQGMQQGAEYQQQQTQTEGIVSGELSIQNDAIAKSQATLQHSFDTALQTASDANKVLLQQMSIDNSEFMQGIDNEQAKWMKEFETDAGKITQITESSNQIMQNYAITVENWMTDPDFLDLEISAQQKAIKDAQTRASNAINLMGATLGMSESINSIVMQYLAVAEE